MVNLTKFGFGAGLLPLIALLMFLSEANADRNDDTPVLDVDASGTVTPLTDGLMILRSMFGFTGDALTDSAVDLTNCQDCDSEEIEKYIADVRGLTFGKINSVDDQNISGSALNGKTLTIGIEDGDSESVDLSGLLDGVGVTSGQASAITANTAKTGITSDQASAITANTAKTGITSDQASAITANTAKTGITSDQASAITANTARTSVIDSHWTRFPDRYYPDWRHEPDFYLQLPVLSGLWGGRLNSEAHNFATSTRNLNFINQYEPSENYTVNRIWLGLSIVPSPDVAALQLSKVKGEINPRSINLYSFSMSHHKDGNYGAIYFTEDEVHVPNVYPVTGVWQRYVSRSQIEDMLPKLYSLFQLDDESVAVNCLSLTFHLNSDFSVSVSGECSGTTTFVPD
ncbi:hypothetical protein N8756_06800 [Pseudomonadales bacterium]|nr:hypothetical protein [Pseudomonadales bacterium]MDA8950979.1 hypothetical protein [Pseudomonadales bacterium]